MYIQNVLEWWPEIIEKVKKITPTIPIGYINITINDLIDVNEQTNITISVQGCITFIPIEDSTTQTQPIPTTVVLYSSKLI